MTLISELSRMSRNEGNKTDRNEQLKKKYR